jgi:hypothetical protein
MQYELRTRILLNLVQDIVLCIHCLPLRRHEPEGQIGEGIYSPRT